MLSRLFPAQGNQALKFGLETRHPRHRSICVSGGGEAGTPWKKKHTIANNESKQRKQSTEIDKNLIN